jgi:hypothetical protein
MKTFIYLKIQTMFVGSMFPTSDSLGFVNQIYWGEKLKFNTFNFIKKI